MDKIKKLLRTIVTIGGWVVAAATALLQALGGANLS